MESELRERIEKLERDKKAVWGRLHREETLADRIWVWAIMIGFIGLGGGIVNALDGGLDLVSFTFILVGGLLTYRWHNQDKEQERDLKILDDIDKELRAAKNELR